MALVSTLRQSWRTITTHAQQLWVRVWHFPSPSWQWFKGFVAEVWQRMWEDRLQLTAAAVAFFLLVSAIPLLTLLLSAVPSFIDIDQLYSTLTATLGPRLAGALRDELLVVAESRRVVTVLSLFVILYTGTQVFAIVETAMNHVWRAERQRPFWQSRLLALLMLCITALVLLIAALLIYSIRVLANQQVPLWNRAVRDIPLLINILLTWMLPILLTTILFSSIFRILPMKKVTWHSALPGALFAAVAWTVFLHLFALYTSSHIVDYSIVYGTLASLILLLFWFYYSSLIMLVGAEITAVYHQRLMEAGDVEEQRADKEEKR